MKTLFVLSLLTLSTSAFAKAPSYRCDDGKKDTGYTITVVDLNQEVQNVVVSKKSALTTTEIFNEYLKRISKVGKLTTFQFKEPDHGLTMKISARDLKGNRTATFLMTTKRGTEVIKTRCAQE